MPVFATLPTDPTGLGGRRTHLQAEPRAEQTELSYCTCDFNISFMVHMDTSEKGLGAVLLQTFEGEEYQVLYVS